MAYDYLHRSVGCVVGRMALAAQDRQRPLQAAAAKRQASQGGRKAAQNRAAATMPGKHGASHSCDLFLPRVWDKILMLHDISLP